MEGWEVSRDRIDKFEKMLAQAPIGDPILTSKCKLDKEDGLLVVSENGFAWRIQMGMRHASVMRAAMSSGKNKWIRWHDLADIIPKKNGQVQVVLKLRKNGALKLDKKGNYKTKRWKLTLNRNKDEQKPHFRIRQESFHNILLEIYDRNRVEADPPTSDSKM